VVRHPETVDAPLSFPAAKLYQADDTVIDRVAVDRLITGTIPWRSTSRAERIAAVAHMTARRIPGPLQAERLGVTSRTVDRLRAAVRELVAATAALDAEIDAQDQDEEAAS
jgi:hypothetical protein